MSLKKKKLSFLIMTKPKTMKTRKKAWFWTQKEDAVLKSAIAKSRTSNEAVEMVSKKLSHRTYNAIRVRICSFRKKTKVSADVPLINVKKVKVEKNCMTLYF